MRGERGRSVVAILGGALVVTAAHGQFAPPPREGQPLPETRLPEPPPPRPEPQPRPQAQPADEPGFDFEPIYEVDASGAPLEPESWPDLLAVVHNPYVRADQREAIARVVRAWQADMRTLVAENPDLCMEVAKGLFENLDVNDQGTWQFAAEVMKALNAAGNLTNRLDGSGVLDNQQAEASRRIVRDYVRARNEAALAAAQEEVGDDQQAAVVLASKATMRNLTADAMRMFRWMLAHAAPMASETMEAADLPAAEHAGALEAVRAAVAGGDEEAVYRAMVGLLDGLGYAGQRRFLEAAADKLPPDPLPELDGLGRVDAQGDGGGDGRGDGSGGGGSGGG